MSNLSKELKTLREDKGLSQLALAAEIGVAQSMICAIERGDRVPSDKLLLRFAEYFNISIGTSYVPGQATPEYTFTPHTTAAPPATEAQLPA